MDKDHKNPLSANSSKLMRLHGPNSDLPYKDKKEALSSKNSAADNEIIFENSSNEISLV